MTCRSHPRAYPAENGHPSHDHNPSLHGLLPSVGTFIPGEPCHLVRADYRSRDVSSALRDDTLGCFEIPRPPIGNTPRGSPDESYSHGRGPRFDPLCAHHSADPCAAVPVGPTSQLVADCFENLWPGLGRAVDEPEAHDDDTVPW